jgi:hypothetical protein
VKKCIFSRYRFLVECMNLLTKELLKEYYFAENKQKSSIGLEILSRDCINIISKKDKFYYSSKGFDYPLRNMLALKKLYKELKQEDLKSK